MQPLNQRPDFDQAKRECKRLHGEYMARTQQEYRTILRNQQVRQRKGQAFEGIEEHDNAVDPRTGWRFYKQRGETCRHRPHPRIGKATIGRQEVRIPGILHGLTIRENFLRLDQFRLPGRYTSRQPTVCADRTPTRTTHFVHVQRITERTAPMFHSRNTRASRIVHCSVSKTNCHPSVMSHMLPHLPHNTSTRSLSPASLVFRPSSPSLSRPTSVHSGLDQETLRDSLRSGGYTKSVSPTNSMRAQECHLNNQKAQEVHCE